MDTKPADSLPEGFFDNPVADAKVMWADIDNISMRNYLILGS